MALTLRAGDEPVPGYRLIRPRGGWAGAHRWEAMEPGGRRVVVRLVELSRPLTAAERDALEAFRGVEHPQILALSHAIEATGLLVLVSPTFEMTLAERLADCRQAGLAGIPRVELAGYLRDAASGLDELNRPRAVPPALGDEALRHRDVRPENLVLAGGTVLVADAGLEALLASVQSATEMPEVASVLYAPPERFRGVLTSQSDQYALAASYVHLRRGRPLFGGSSVAEVLSSHLGWPPDLDGLDDDERPELARALEKDPARRWPTASELAAALAVPVPAPSSSSSSSLIEPATALMSAAHPVSTTSLSATAASPEAAASASAIATPPKPKAAAPPANVPVAKPARPRVPIQAATEDEEIPGDTTTNIEPVVKGWSTSLVVHALVLLLLAFWIFAPSLREHRTISARMAGSDDMADLAWAEGMDAPLDLPELELSPLDPTLAEPNLPQIELDPLSTEAASDPQTGDVGQLDTGAGQAEGFGPARFGDGSEIVQGVEVQVGDPQFTLIWNSNADIDLHVQEPGGSHIYWDNRRGRQGGELDVDDVDGFGPENIYWIQGKGPSGEYRWYVHYYGPGTFSGGIAPPTRWKVRVKHKDKVTLYEGRLDRVGQRSRTYSLRVDWGGADSPGR